MEFALWLAIIGMVLVVMALSDSVLARLPLSTSMLYLLVGVAVSPLLFGLSSIRPLDHVTLLEHLAEIVVLLSLFTSGMKMSVGTNDLRWLLPLRLAVGSMVVTVGLVAAVGVFLLGLPLGAAVILGAVLAPTDPVLASDVQIARPTDQDRLRFSLTGEAGLNDGTAFPFVMLGLGLLGLHELGPMGARWLGVDVLWATVWGLGVGAALGTAVGKLVLYLRRKHHEATGLDNFLALGLIALAYGVAVLGLGYGFLAVFAAGVALRRVERLASSDADAEAGADARARADASGGAGVDAGASGHAGPAGRGAPQASAALQDAEDAGSTDEEKRADVAATDPRRAPAFMAYAVLRFNEQMERIGEVTAVTVVGMLLWAVDWSRVPWWFVPVMLLLIRPVSAAIGLAGSRTSRTQRVMIGWFGIRGIGSLYYLMYAINKGMDPALAETLIALTLATVVVSIAVHGVSVTPLMNFYERRKGGSRRVAG